MWPGDRVPVKGTMLKGASAVDGHRRIHVGGDRGIPRLTTLTGKWTGCRLKMEDDQPL
jgi:hypothetical protein